MSESQEGSGGRSARTRRGSRLVNRAMRKRWAIPPALRTSLVDQLGQIVRDPRAGPRDVITAAKALLAASKINLQSVSVTIKAQVHEELEDQMTDIERRLDKRKSNGAGY